MLTDIDINKLKKIFVTKKDFGRRMKGVDKRFDRLSMHLDYQLKPFEEFKREFKSFKDQVITSLDFLVSSYKKFEDEYLVISHQLSRADSILNNHEVRLSQLEEKSRKKPS